MRPRFFLLALAGLASTALGGDLAELATEAQRAYLRRDLPTAKEKFGLILQLDPSNRLAKSYLTRIRTEEAQQRAAMPPPNATQTALTKLILDKVEFREASLSEVLDFLKQKGNQVGGGKVAINFVQQLDETAQSAKITLSLQNTPYSEVLHYIGKLGNVQFIYEPYAIVVKPMSATQPGSAGNGTPQPQTGNKIPGF